MKLHNHFLTINILALLIIILSAPQSHSWTMDAHKWILHEAVKRMPDSKGKEYIKENLEKISYKVMDPDFRKGKGGALEMSYHKINLEEYFKYGFKIENFPWDKKKITEAVGKENFIEIGQGPWGLKEVFDNMVKALKSRDKKNFIQLAADFAHYEGDLHNPLHITSNYNGQLSGNFGVHIRFEKDLTLRFLSEVKSEKRIKINKITNFEKFTFAHLKKSFTHVALVIRADKTAQWEPGLYDEKYYSRYWMLVKDVYYDVLNDAADNLACYLHTAVLNAGLK